MLTFEQAKKRVIDSLKIEKLLTTNDSLIVIDDWTIEKPYAWIFIYTSKLWYETKDDKYAIVGNAPIIVDKRTGKHTSYSTAYSIDSIIDKYEEEEKIWSLVLVDKNSLDKNKILLLKNKMSLGYDQIMRLKKDNNVYIDSGSRLRLILIQTDLLEIGIETKLMLSWNNNPFDKGIS